MSVRTALVTGGNRGIGHAIADKFRREGVNVLSPGRAEMDLLSNCSIDNYLAGLDGSVDILINNAGINPLGTAAEFTDTDLEATLQVNLVAPLRLIRALAPAMTERRFGRIVNISSIWSAVSKPRRTVYSTAKSGINGMTRAVAIELAQYNVLVNAVAPGFVSTSLTRQNNSPEELERIAATIPCGRLAEPSEIAALVLFLCSDQNSYITGQTLFIDGGYTCL
jgi:NAD(P)-dependent dehydrogenase (short-subunit alcohol dehydrogenase family)